MQFEYQALTMTHFDHCPHTRILHMHLSPDASLVPVSHVALLHTPRADCRSGLVASASALLSPAQHRLWVSALVWDIVPPGQACKVPSPGQ
jgi:hypothetical protein